jgi:hypothetical protein
MQIGAEVSFGFIRQWNILNKEPASFEEFDWSTSHRLSSALGLEPPPPGRYGMLNNSMDMSMLMLQRLDAGKKL